MAWPDEGWGDARLISSKLKACIPGNDASTIFLDISGNSNHLVVEAGNTEAFNIDGFFKTTAGSLTGGLNIPQNKIQWNPYRESIVLSFMLNRATPEANEVIFSIGSSNAGNQGFYISHRSSGLLRIIPILNTGAAATGTVDSNQVFSNKNFEVYTKTITLQAASSANVDAVISIPKNTKIVNIMADTTVAWTATTASLTVGSSAGGTQYASGSDVKTITRAPTAAYTAAQLAAMDNVGANTSIHVRVASTGATAVGTTAVTVLLAKPALGTHVTIAYDAPTGSWYLFKDGVLDSSSSSYVNFSTGANAFADAISNAELRVGMLASLSATAVNEVLGYGLQFAKYSGALTSNIGLIASKLANNPTLPISGLEW